MTDPVSDYGEADVQRWAPIVAKTRVDCDPVLPCASCVHTTRTLLAELAAAGRLREEAERTCDALCRDVERDRDVLRAELDRLVVAGRPALRLEPFPERGPRDDDSRAGWLMLGDWTVAWLCPIAPERWDALQAAVDGADFAAGVAAGRTQAAAEIRDHPGPDPSPASPAWWAGYQEAQRDAARIAEGSSGGSV